MPALRAEAPSSKDGLEMEVVKEIILKEEGESIISVEIRTETQGSVGYASIQSRRMMGSRTRVLVRTRPCGVTGLSPPTQ